MNNKYDGSFIYSPKTILNPRKRH